MPLKAFGSMCVKTAASSSHIREFWEVIQADKAPKVEAPTVNHGAKARKSA